MQILEVLKRLGNVEWGGGGMRGSTYPPIIVWRYSENHAEIADRLEGVISTFRGNVDWAFFKGPTRNMVLEPKRVVQLVEGGQCLGDRDAAGYLSDVDPEFGRSANADLEMLAKHIAAHLLED